MNVAQAMCASSGGVTRSNRLLSRLADNPWPL